MTAKRTHHRKPRDEGDQNVSIRLEVFRAAMEEAGIGPSTLATLTGSQQQTISAIWKHEGYQRSVRRDRARKIADALQIPFEWLTDGIAYSSTHPLVAKGYEFRYSTRTELAASRLFTRCDQACQRDLDLNPTESRRGYSPDALKGQLVSLITELIQVVRWRHWLLEWNAGLLEERGGMEPATESTGKPISDPAHEATILGLCRAMEHILTPWFEGSAKLNYDALYRLTALPADTPMRQDVDHLTPAAALPPPSPQQPIRPLDQRRAVKKAPAKRRNS